MLRRALELARLNLANRPTARAFELVADASDRLWSKPMPDRRTFLITCGGMVAAPVFAQLRTCLWRGEPPASPGGSCPAKLVLRIDGWDTPIASIPTYSDVWIQINSSWRATWR